MEPPIVGTISEAPASNLIIWAETELASSNKEARQFTQTADWQRRTVNSRDITVECSRWIVPGEKAAVAASTSLDHPCRTKESLLPSRCVGKPENRYCWTHPARKSLWLPGRGKIP